MFTFKGGVHPHEMKELSKDKPIRVIKTSDEMVYPMSQHLGKPAEVCVSVGDEVLMGQIIGKANGPISANVVCGCSGKVKAIEKRTILGGAKVDCVVVTNDNQDKTISGYGEKRDYHKLSNEEIVDIVKDAGIVGLGGAGFPTNVKLTPKDANRIDYVLVNGAECEPYLTSDYRLMVERPEKLIQGLEVILKLFPNAKGVICIEDNKKDVYEKISSMLNGNASISCALLKTKYPQGGERQLIYAVTKRKINSKVLPAEVGCIVDNVDTVIAIGEAVCESKPLIRRIMTIAGDGFNNNENLEVRLGTSYTTVIEEVGGLKEGVKKMISGGPMMGVAIYDVNIPVSKSSSAFLAFMKDPIEKLETTMCIRCGKCHEACPINLLPNKLGQACKHENIEEFIRLDGIECIECGSCSYICPAKQPLTQYFRAYKPIARNYLAEQSKKEAK